MGGPESLPSGGPRSGASRGPGHDGQRIGPANPNPLLVAYLIDANIAIRHSFGFTLNGGDFADIPGLIVLAW